jgi:hypothetical protein
MTTGFNLFVMGGTALYSPSFPRGGESALFSAETLAKIGAPSLTIDVEHKNFDDTLPRSRRSPSRPRTSAGSRRRSG